MPSRIKLSAVLIAVGVTLLTGPSAMAGTYDVYSCRLPDGAPAPTDGWSSWLSHPDVPWMVQNDCPRATDSCSGSSGWTDAPSTTLAGASMHRYTR